MGREVKWDGVEPMDVEELDDDFFSFEAPKPVVPAGGGFSKPGAARAGRRAGGGSLFGSESVVAGAGSDSTTDSAPVLAPSNAPDIGSIPSGHGVGGRASGAVLGEASAHAGGGDAENEQGSYLPGVGRVGRGRRNFIVGQPQVSAETAFAPTVGSDDKGSDFTGLRRNDAPQNQPLMGRRASPPADHDFHSQQSHQQQGYQPTAQDNTPAMGAGAYVPSMGRRGRAAGGLLGLGGGDGIGGDGLFNNGRINHGDGMLNPNSNNEMNPGNYAGSRMGGDAAPPQHLQPHVQHGAGAGSIMQEPARQQAQHHGQQVHQGYGQLLPQHQYGQHQQQHQAPMLPHHQVNAGQQPAQQLVQEQQWNGGQGGPVLLNNYGSQQQAAAQEQPVVQVASKVGGGGGFKFKFGAKKEAAPSVPAAASAQQAQPQPHSLAQDVQHANSITPVAPSGLASYAGVGGGARSLSPELPGPAVRASFETANTAHGGRQSQASRMSHESSSSSVGGGGGADKDKDGALVRGRRGGGEVKKSERLRKLEEELEGMGVTQELAHAYVDPSGRNRRPRCLNPRPKSLTPTC